MLSVPVKTGPAHPWHSMKFANHESDILLYGEGAERAQRKEEFLNFRKKHAKTDFQFMFAEINTKAELLAFLGKAFDRGDKIIINCHGDKAANIPFYDGTVAHYSEWNDSVSYLLSRGVDVAVAGVFGKIISPFVHCPSLSLLTLFHCFPLLLVGYDYQQRRDANFGRFIEIPFSPALTNYSIEKGETGTYTLTATHSKLQNINLHSFQLSYWS